MTKAMRVLSGDHWIAEAPPFTSLTFRASPPRRSSSQIWAPFFCSSSVPRDATNARYVPSGLQRGDDSSSGDEVSCRRALPSHLTIQMSVFRLSFSTSLVVAVYATHSPSGERCGSATATSRE